MWANAQHDDHHAEYRYRPLVNATVWLTPITRVPCSNAAKTRNPYKFAGVPQTLEPISAASGPKFTMSSGRVEEVLLFNKFISDSRYVPQLWRYSLTKLCDGAEMEFFCVLIFSNRVQHVSDLHPKFALRPHHVWKYGRHPIWDHWD